MLQSETVLCGADVNQPVPLLYKTHVCVFSFYFVIFKPEHVLTVNPNPDTPDSN